MDTLTILHFVIKKGGSRVARHGKSEAQREYYQARVYRKWRFPHKRRRVQTAGSPRTLSHTHCSFSLCASSQKQFSPRSHAMFRTPLDPRFTAPSQSTPTFLHNCSLQKWASTATPLCVRFCPTIHTHKIRSTTRVLSSKSKKGFETILQRFQGCETYRSSQLNIGWTEEFCKHLDEIAREENGETVVRGG